MKRDYFERILEQNKFNIRKTWTILKSAINKRKDNINLPHTFNILNEQVSDRTQLAESFNDYFANIGQNISDHVPASTRDYASYMPDRFPRSIFLDPVDPPYVLQVSQKLKSKTSSGYDDISSKIFKDTISCIILPVTHILNLSFDSGIVPDKLKIAKVIPIFKSTDPTELKNYP